MAVAFTDRHGGVSTGSYASLNLAERGGDNPSAVAENLRRVAEEFNPGGPLISMRQVHGEGVVLIERDSLGAPTPVCDVLVTGTVGTALMVRAADCVPVLIGDHEAHLVAAVHCGRVGLIAGVVPAALSAMHKAGADQLTAWVGPHICGRCYEVPEGLRDEVTAAVPDTWAETAWGTPSLDLFAGVGAQLSAAGVEVVDATRCTVEDRNYYSYRRDSAGAGRFAGLIAIRS